MSRKKRRDDLLHACLAPYMARPLVALVVDYACDMFANFIELLELGSFPCSAKFEVLGRSSSWMLGIRGDTTMFHVLLRNAGVERSVRANVLYFLDWLNSGSYDRDLGLMRLVGKIPIEECAELRTACMDRIAAWAMGDQKRSHKANELLIRRRT